LLLGSFQNCWRKTAHTSPSRSSRRPEGGAQRQSRDPGFGLLPTVGSTGERNTLLFLMGWSVADEAAEADLLLGGPAG
jgi:hypothetical protein